MLECHFGQLVQYLVTLDCKFSWQGVVLLNWVTSQRNFSSRFSTWWCSGVRWRDSCRIRCALDRKPVSQTNVHSWTTHASRIRLQIFLTRFLSGRCSTVFVYLEWCGRRCTTLERDSRSCLQKFVAASFFRGEINMFKKNQSRNQHVGMQKSWSATATQVEACTFCII